jgi:hypothetical protein
VSADGFITREQWITWQAGARDDVTLDLIRDTAPFSSNFYREMVRGAYDQEGSPYPVLRLLQAPKFYFKTVDQTGRALEPTVISYVSDALRRAVPLYTGGLYSASLEVGTETRPDTPGVINVLVNTDLAERSTCGYAYIGREAGEITFVINDVCSCGSVKISGAVVLHEVAHALGFFHVSDRNSVLYPQVAGRCPVGEPSAAERFHAGIAYSRPRGNTDPDSDPTSGRLLTFGGATKGILIRN